MRTATRSSLLSCVFIAALTMSFVLQTPTYAAEPADGKALADSKMMDHCKEMKEKKQKMKETQQALDKDLIEQIAKLNSAPDDKKVNLMAAILSQMIDNRIKMDAEKSKIEEDMMKHMMQHMQMGKESMGSCPMMKGMKDMKDMDVKEGGDHKDHHPDKK